MAESSDDGGRNALQALFAFACLHQQATQRRGQLAGADKAGASPRTPQEEFALDEVLQLVAARALSITGSDGVAIALADDGAIVCRACAGDIAPDPGVRLDPNSGFSGACLRSGQTIRCDDSDTDTRVNAKACRALGTRSMVAVPLSAKQRVIGLIEAFSKEPFGFNDSDVRSLNLLAELILAAVRPEEENRLAEISRQIITPEPAKAPEPAVAMVSTAETIAPKPSRILVDEKFTPAPLPAAAEAPQVVAVVPAKPETPEDETVLPGLPDAKPEEPRGRIGAVVTTLAKRVGLGPKELEAPGELPSSPRSILGTAVVAAAVLVLIGLGFVIWRYIRHAEAISANSQPPQVFGSKQIAAHEVLSPPEPVAKPGSVPEVTGIRNWSAADSSTVVIDLEDQVQYEAHTLSNPERIYFDLHDTKIPAALVNKIVVLDNDPFLKRIRMAQPVEGVTRIVLETKGAAEFTVSLDPNPYRLNVEVHKPGPVTEMKVTPASTTKPSAGISPRSAKTIPAATSNEFRIALDAGHGGWDLGTVGKKGLLEKNLVLDVVQRLGKLVESKLGAEVVYTRQDDSYLPLEKRAEIANLAKADLFLSVHANYSDLATARGVETYYTKTYSSVKARTDGDDPQLKQVDWTGVDIRAKVTDSHRFASDVQQALYGGLVERNPDLRNRGVKQAEYVVLTGTQMPAVLAEVSFVSSPADEDKLQNAEYRQFIAEALYRGIVKYRDETKRTKLASAKKSLN
jgi:N-acetylmuramoyl-L-alanine amidase/putative methionine-R-sulfoxide reductase with GAF domain